MRRFSDHGALQADHCGGGLEAQTPPLGKETYNTLRKMDPTKNPTVFDPNTGLPAQAQAHPAQAHNTNTGLQANAVTTL